MILPQFIYERIEAIQQAVTPAEVLRALAAASARFGFTACGIPLLPGEGGRPGHHGYFHNWPQAWGERYLDQDYVSHDPVVRRMRESLRPFAWHEAPVSPRDPIAARVMQEAAEFGLRAGFCVPLAEKPVNFACVTFGGENFALGPDERPGLHLIALCAQDRLQTLLAAAPPQRHFGSNPTGRELEILKWCAAGKTSRDIGEILAISDQTVERHVANACRRLNAANRTQAVAEVIRRGLLA